MAEREGFEPSVRLRVHLISSQARSATPAPLRKLCCRHDGYAVRTPDLFASSLRLTPLIASAGPPQVAFRSAPCAAGRVRPATKCYPCISPVGPPFGRSKSFPTILSATPAPLRKLCCRHDGCVVRRLVAACLAGPRIVAESCGCRAAGTGRCTMALFSVDDSP